jgi:hypothetical protein
MASVQAVMPLVYRYLTSELGGTLPAEATSGLRRAFYGNSVRNLHLARELVRLTTLLEQGGVEPLALKGPALATAAYGAVTMRQFNDLDLLVRKGEVRRAADILLAAGYAPRAGYRLADLDRPGAYEIAMVRTGALMEIDLHWRLIPPYFPLALDSEDLWRRAVRIEVEGAPVRTLTPADHLLYLCAHGAKHGWQALGGICDLAELIRATSRAPAPTLSQSSSQVPYIDWDELSARAEQAAAHRALELGVLLAHELLDAAVPAGILAAARRERAVVRAARSFIAYASDRPDVALFAQRGYRGRTVLPILQVSGFNLGGQGPVGRYADAIAAAFEAVGLHPRLLLLMVFAGLVGTRALLGRWQSVAMFSVQQNFGARLRDRLYHAISGASWLALSRMRSSDLTHALTSEIDRVEVAAFEALILASTALLFLLYHGIALAVSPSMTALALGCGIVLVAMLRGRTALLRGSGAELSERTKALYAATVEHLQSLKAAKMTECSSVSRRLRDAQPRGRPRQRQY